MSGLACWLGIDRRTLVNYSNKEEFFRTISTARAIVQADMEERALNGDSNATMSIFSFKTNFGWNDKQEIASTNTNVNKNIDLSNYSLEELKKLIDDED